MQQVSALFTNFAEALERFGQLSLEAAQTTLVVRSQKGGDAEVSQQLSRLKDSHARVSAVNLPMLMTPANLK
eukprot:2312752-Alexandrium_andersonii.AAC.1